MLSPAIVLPISLSSGSSEVSLYQKLFTPIFLATLMLLGSTFEVTSTILVPGDVFLMRAAASSPDSPSRITMSIMQRST